MSLFQRKPEIQSTYWNPRKAVLGWQGTQTHMRLHAHVPAPPTIVAPGPGGQTCGHLRPSFCRKDALLEQARTQRRQLQELQQLQPFLRDAHEVPPRWGGK